MILGPLNIHISFTIEGWFKDLLISLEGCCEVKDLLGPLLLRGKG